MGRQYRSLDIVFDPGTATVLGPWGARPLRRQVAQCLAALLERAPALVTVDELLDVVWGRHAISPSAVPQAIRELRRALDDDARSPRFIETRHRLGYRWIAPVEEAASAGTPPTDAADAPAAPAAGESPPAAAERLPDGSDGASSARSDRRGLWWATLALAVLAVAMLALRPGTQHAPSPSADPRWRAAQEAFLDARMDAAVQSLDGWKSPPAIAHALRARIAIRRAEPGAVAALRAARAAPGADDSETAQWLSVLEAQAEGREIAAWAALEPLLALRPADPDLLLAAWELRKRMPAERVAALADRLERLGGVPTARRALLAAEIAGYRRDAARRHELAQAALDAHRATHPAIAALATAELAAAAGERRDPGLARRLAQEAATALEAQGLRRAALRALGDAAWQALVQDRLDDAVADLERMQRLLEGRLDPAGTALLHHYRAMSASRRGEHAAAIDAFGTLAAEYEALGDLRAAAMALQSSVAPRYALERGNEVPAVIERALVLAGHAQANDTIGFLNGTLGNHLVRSGDLDLGQERLLRALDAFRLAGDRRAEATALGNLAEVAILRGRLEDAAAHVERAIDVQSALGSASGEAYAQLRLARIRASRGDLAGARDAGARAAQGFAAVGEPREQAVARRHLGIVHLRRTELAQARAERAAIAALGDTQPRIRAEGEFLAGEIAFYAGDFATARRHAEAAAAAWQAAELPLDAAQARLAALRARLASGQRVAVEEEARRLLSEPVVAQSPALTRECGLLLAESLVARPQTRTAEDALAAVDAALVRAPDAEDALRAAMLRAVLDADPSTRRERLAWAVAQADRQGLALFALEAGGRLAADSGEDALRAWRDQAAPRAAGLARRAPATGR